MNISGGKCIIHWGYLHSFSKKTRKTYVGDCRNYLDVSSGFTQIFISADWRRVNQWNVCSTVRMSM